VLYVTPLTGWTPDLDIPGGQAGVFFHGCSGKKKGSTEKGKGSQLTMPE